MTDSRTAVPAPPVGPAPAPEPGLPPAATSPLRAGRRADVVVAAVLALLGVLLYLPTAPFYFRPDDDGLALMAARLILAGQRPFVDFFLHDSPAVHYWDALLLQIGGVDMLTLRLGLVPFKVLLLPLIYGLARPVAGRAPAALAAVLVLMADSGVNFGMPHPGWYGLVLGLAGLAALAAWLRGGRTAWLLGAGALLGLAVDVKQNLGLYLVGATVLVLLEPIAPAAGPGRPRTRGADDRRLRAVRALAWLGALGAVVGILRDQLRLDVLILLWVPLAVLAVLTARPAAPPVPGAAAIRAAAGRLAVFGAGVVLVAGPWLAFLASITGWPGLWVDLLEVPSRLPQVMFFPYKPPPPEFWGVVLLAAAPPLVAWAIVRRRPGAVGVALGAAAVVAAAVLLLWRGTDFVWQGGIFSWYYVPPALIWLALLLPAAPGPARPGVGLYTRFLLIAAAFGMLQLYPLMDRVHGAWSYPFTLPLVAVVLERGTGWFRAAAARAPARRTAARLLPLTLLGLPLLWLVFGASWRLGLWWDVPASLAAGRPVASDWRPLALPHASLIAPGPMVTTYQGVVAYVDAHTAPGEPIYAFPNEQAFYAMAERPRGSTHSYLLPGVTSLAEQRAVIADLSAAPVRTLIVYVPATSLGSLAPLATWIAANYHTVATFGTAPDVYGVMEHN